MDGKIADKRDLVSHLDWTQAGKVFYKLRDSNREFANKTLHLH